jgi:hypothetical protein
MSKHLTKMIIALVFCGLAAAAGTAFADEPAKPVKRSIGVRSKL